MTGTFLFSGRNNDRAPARQTTGTFFFPVIIMILHLPDRRLYLYFFPVVITIANDRLPARQTTGTFLLSGRNNDCAPARQTTGTFFSGRNNDRAPARQTTVSFFSSKKDTVRKKFLLRPEKKACLSFLSRSLYLY